MSNNPQNPQAVQAIQVGQQSLKKMPLNTPLIAKGFIIKEEKVEHRVDVTLKINEDCVRMFVNKNHPHFNWWKHEAQPRVFADLYFVLTKPHDEKYNSFIGELLNFSPTAYEEPTVVNEHALKVQLYAHLESIQHSSLKALWQTFLLDKERCARFFYSPSTTESAYSFKGGLATHTVVMMDRIDTQVSAWAPRYFESYSPSPLNRDLLKTAALFHDSGKMFAYELVDGEVKTTPAGHLLGKTGLSLQFLQQIYQEMLLNHPDFMLEGIEFLQLQHIIASANRELEYGALVTPKTKEAECFAYLEGLDSSIGDFHDLERKNAEPGFVKAKGRHLYVTPYSGTYEELIQSTEVVSDEVTPTSEEVAPTNDDASEAVTSTVETTEGGSPLDFVVSNELTTPLLNETSMDDEWVEYEEDDSTEDDLTYEPDPMFQSMDTPSEMPTEVVSVPVESEPITVDVTPMVRESATSVPFVGESTSAVTTDDVHPTFMTPVMNIPAEWPETPSTEPVLANGMPVQPIIAVQQPMTEVANPTSMPLPNVDPQAFNTGFDVSLPPLPPLPPLTPFQPEKPVTDDMNESLETPVVDEEVKPAKKTTTKRATKSTTTKSTAKSTATKSTAKKSTKSTKNTKSSTTSAEATLSAPEGEVVEDNAM